jgi:TPR repeat protein
LSALLRHILPSLMTVLIAVPLARAQSPTTLAGMQAYNRGDFAAAYRLLRQAADAGDPEGQVNLGYLYARGHGVRVNQLEALRLYELSAKGGSSEGMNALGFKYRYATGVPKDSGRAAYWFCEAVVRGNPRGNEQPRHLLSERS